MRVSMCDSTIYSQFSTDPDTYHHETNLINLTVTKDAPKVIFNHRIKNGEHGHNSTNSDQDICTRKKSGEHTNRTFSGKCTQPDRTGMSSLRISIF